MASFCWEPNRAMRATSGIRQSTQGAMRAWRRTFRRLTAWATRRRDEERLRAEIEEHLELQTADNIRSGLTPAEARRQAVLKFGGVEAMKESYRDQRGLPLLETLTQDTRHALRRLRLAPAFTIATILTLALGIGATTSIFTLVHAVLLKSLAGGQARRTVPLRTRDPLLRLGRIHPGPRVLAGLVRAVPVFEGPHHGLLGAGGVSLVPVAVRRQAAGQPGGSPNLSRRVRVRQLLRDVRHRRLRRANAHAR